MGQSGTGAVKRPIQMRQTLIVEDETRQESGVKVHRFWTTEVRWKNPFWWQCGKDWGGYYETQELAQSSGDFAVS